MIKQLRTLQSMWTGGIGRAIAAERRVSVKRSRSGICDASRRNLKRAGRFISRDGGALSY